MAWFLLTRPAAAPAATSPAQFSIPVQHRQHGLDVTPHWKLPGSGHPLLRETVQLSNTGATALIVTFAEPAPAPPTGSHGTVVFTPLNYQITHLGRTVEWALRMPAHDRETVGYTWTGATGVTRAQLAHWAREFVVTSAPVPPKAAHLQSLRIRPRTITVIVGSSARLRLSGVLSNGKKVAAADLSNAVWKSARSGVVAVNRAGRITGRAVGRARITVRIGDIRASILVTVTPQVTSSVGTTQSPTPSPTVHSPTPTPTPSTPPTLTGSPPPSRSG